MVTTGTSGYYWRRSLSFVLGTMPEYGYKIGKRAIWI
jgi:hypothetical protein